VKNLEKREKFMSDLRPAWAVEVDKVLAEKRITKKQLANDLNVSYGHLTNIMTGVTNQPSNSLRDSVYAYLGIKIDGEEGLNHDD
jgi:transcriptional regulator with XRE-family HTH domain